MSDPGAADDLLWQHLKTLPAFRALLRAVESRFYHAVELPEPLLDLGCGDGDFARHTFNEYGRVLGTGLDPWWNPLKKSSRAEIYGRGVVQGLGDNMPFPDHTFASAMSNSVLEHIPDIQPVLNETSRVLRPGGRFLITMPNHQYTRFLGGAQRLERWGLPGLADRYRRGFNFIARHAHTEGIEWWAARLAEAGLAIERWQYYFSPEALHVLEIGHAQGLPSWVSHALTGQWILAPTRDNLRWTERWVRPYFLEQADENGTMVMIVARKVADRPIAVHIPAAAPFEVDPQGRLVGENVLSAEVLSADVLGAEVLSAEVLGAEVLGADVLSGSPSPVTDHPSPTTHHPSPTSHHPLPILPLPSLRQLGLGVVALLLGYLAYSMVGTFGAEKPLLGVVLWVGAIGAALLSTFLSPLLQPAGWPPRLTLRWPGTAQSRLIGIGLTAAALGLRLFDLTGHPFVLSGTEAALGNDAWWLISGLWKNPFGTVSLSNPALPLYPVGAALVMFGKSMWGIRILSAVGGALGVGAVYAFGRRLFSETVGVAAAILLLGLHTHLHYSRLGLTNIWDPLLMTVGSALFVLAWQRGRRWEWLLAALVWGVSGYFFTVSRLLPVVLGVLAVWLLVVDRPGWRKNASYLIGATFVALVMTLPLIRHYRAVPGVFGGRYNQYGLGPTHWINQQALQSGRSTNAIWLDHLSGALTAFNGAVDQSLYYGAERGLNGWVIGLLFVVGIGLALRYVNQIRFQLLLLWVGGTILAGIMMIQAPSSHRYLIATPAVALLGGVALATAARWLTTRWTTSTSRIPVRLLLVVVLALAAVVPDLAFYWGSYRQNGQFADANTEVGQRIGELLAPRPVGETVYLFGAPRIFSDFPNITYLASQFVPRQSIRDVSSPAEIEVDSLENGVVIVLPEQAAVLPELEQRFPEAQVEAVNGRYAAPLFYVIDEESD